MSDSLPHEETEADCTKVKFLYVYDRKDSPQGKQAAVDRRQLPTTAQQAIGELFSQNAAYARFMAACHVPPGESGSHCEDHVRIPLTPREVGLERDPVTQFPKQKPFAAVLGCVDARAPVEIAFSQGFDDLYTFRVAGNTLGPDCAASLHYALHKLAALKGTPESALQDRTLRLAVALGHADCGAVTAVVDTVLGHIDMSSHTSEFLVDDSVRGLLGRIHLPAVNLAARALPVGSFGHSAQDAELHRRALIELAVYVNAAWSGHDMQAIVNEYCFVPDKEVEVRYGVLDPRDCFVRSVEGYRFCQGGTSLEAPRTPEEALSPPPRDLHELDTLTRRLAEELKRQHAQGEGKKALGTFFRL